MKYLDVIREKILSKCNWGGQGIINAENEDSLDDSGYLNLYKDHCGPIFILRQPHEDKLEMNVFFHNTILLSKNLKKEIHSFVYYRKKMCRISQAECGTRLHGELFMKCSKYSKIVNHPHQEQLPLAYPGSFLVDYRTRVSYLKKGISHFEVSDLYMSGLLHRKLCFYLNTRTVVSGVNADYEIYITLHRPYRDEQFLVRLYVKGARELKKEKWLWFASVSNPQKCLF